MHFECRVPGYPTQSSTKTLSTWSICRWLRESLTRGYTCMFNWTKVLPNSFPLPIPFWDPLKFDQKVPHVFLLILNAHHTICFSVTYNMVLMLINLLVVALSWHVEYTQCKALFCLIPKPAGFLEIIGVTDKSLRVMCFMQLGEDSTSPRTVDFRQ